LVIPGLKRVRRNRRLRTIRNGDVTAAWDEIVDQLTDLGHDVPEHQTPIEFARSTDRSLVPLATAYGASVYGGHRHAGRIDDFLAVERWVKLKYEGGQRARASFNPTSLLRRRGSAS
jgi:Asp-tRNA(Asn)/Glu-tRNA(Gln) amidotransferase A subunit family amidase